MKALISIIAMLSLVGCTTYSVTMVHSQGSASDVVDETQAPSTSTTVSPNVSVPASIIP